MKNKDKGGKGVPEEPFADLPKREDDSVEGGLERDQAERGYYYDDAHGYQTYDPETEEPETGTTSKNNK